MRLAAVRSTPAGARLLVLALVAALAVLTTGSARADEPSLNQLHEQQRKAAQLDRLADQQVVRSRDAAGRLADLAARAGKALDAYATLRDAAFTARAEEAAQRELYDAARLLAIRERSNLGRYAASAYRNGGGGAGQMAMLASLLESRSITEMGRGAADLEWAGNQQSYVLVRVRAAEAAAAASAARAASASAARTRSRT